MSSQIIINTQPLNTLPPGVHKRLTTNVRSSGLGDLIFRRIGRHGYRKGVTAKQRDLVCVKYFKPHPEDPANIVMETMTPAEYRDRHHNRETRFTPDEIEKNLEFNYKKFFFSTNAHGPGMSGGEYDGTPIFCLSKNFSQIDITEKCTLEFSKDQGIRFSQVPPREEKTKIIKQKVWTNDERTEFKMVDKTVTVEGDLIAMVVAPPAKKGDLPTALYWCIISEQFMRMCILLLHDHHPTFNHYGPSPERMKRRLMSGNRLMTNSFSKWVVSHQDTNRKPDAEEAVKRYYHLRTERSSVGYIHIYNAIVLMVRYGEIPGDNNVPNNLSLDGLSVEKWDLPRNFISNFMKKWANYEPQQHVNVGQRTTFNYVSVISDPSSAASSSN